MKLRSDSILAQLTEPQLDDLYNWLLRKSYDEVEERCLKPPPEGFGLKIQHTTLVRFFRKERQRRRAEEAAEHAAPVDPATALSEAKAELAYAAWENSRSEALNAKSMNDLSRALHRQELAAIKREYLEIARQQMLVAQQRLELERARLAELKRQFEFDAAREVMKNNLAYNKIHNTQGIDEQDKIWLARDITFGQLGTTPPTSFPSTPSQNDSVLGTELNLIT